MRLVVVALVLLTMAWPVVAAIAVAAAVKAVLALFRHRERPAGRLRADRSEVR
jgi:hypothetical protein